MATACRNGYNKVMLGLESSHNENEINYEVAFFSDADYKKWNINRLCWIKTIASKVGITHEQKVTIVMMARNLEANNITPMTTSSNTVEWFAARKGSFTSYPTDRIINCMLRLSKSTRDILSIENDDINTCFRYLGKINNIVDEHADTIQHSIFMLEINCNADDGKKARFNLKSDVTKKDDNNNKYNKDKLLNIVECLTGESKKSFSKLT